MYHSQSRALSKGFQDDLKRLLRRSVDIQQTTPAMNSSRNPPPVYGQRYLNLISKSMHIQGQPGGAPTPNMPRMPFNQDPALVSPRLLYAEAAASVMDRGNAGDQRLPPSTSVQQQANMAALSYLGTRSQDGHFYSASSTPRTSLKATQAAQQAATQARMAEQAPVQAHAAQQAQVFSAQDMFDRVDTNGDGVISRSEWTSLLTHNNSALSATAAIPTYGGATREYHA